MHLTGIMVCAIFSLFLLIAILPSGCLCSWKLKVVCVYVLSIVLWTGYHHFTFWEENGKEKEGENGGGDILNSF